MHPPSSGSSMSRGCIRWWVSSLAVGQTYRAIAAKWWTQHHNQLSMPCCHSVQWLKQPIKHVCQHTNSQCIATAWRWLLIQKKSFSCGIKLIFLFLYVHVSMESYSRRWNGIINTIVFYGRMVNICMWIYTPMIDMPVPILCW